MQEASNQISNETEQQVIIINSEYYLISDHKGEEQYLHELYKNNFY